MIGLKRGTVQVVPHDASWSDLFAQERNVLHPQIGQNVLDIQHVGSTAVPELDAKPIIDIAVAVDSPAMIGCFQQLLSDLGYLDRGDFGHDGGHLFVKEREPEVRRHHLHIVTIDGSQWRNCLLFRDMLSADDILRARYGALQRALREQHANDRQIYAHAKAEFIRGVLEGSG
jgi:GrpB-like predicted nucleotidyltransferase (UPF0157 family)